MQLLISTDLDGTLLNHHDYQWQAALPALNACRQLNVPIVLNSSKTYDEVVELQQDLDLGACAIVENGSALIFDIDYLKPPKMSDERFLDILSISSAETGGSPEIMVNDRQIRCLFGETRLLLLAFLNKVRQTETWNFAGFNDWSVTQLIEKTGLSEQQALSALNKHYSEPFEWYDNEENFQELKNIAEKSHYVILTGGRFHHLQGNTTKAKPLLWLKKVMIQLMLEQGSVSENSPELKLICLGDNHNDVDMLNIADYPVCVRSPVAKFPLIKKNKNTLYTELEGSQGWNVAVLNILERYHKIL